MSRYNKEYYEAHKKEIRANQIRYEDSHKTERQIYLESTKDKRVARGKLYYENHKEEILAKNKEYNRGHRKERNVYLEIHKAERAAKHIIYRQNHKSKLDNYNKEYHRTHKAQELESAVEYRKNHKGKIKEYKLHTKNQKTEYRIKYFTQLKEDAMSHYGKDGKCACVKCGYSDNIDGLELDHINGKGCEHRRNLKGATMYLWLKHNNYPEGLQTLCGTCHRIKTHDDIRRKLIHRQLQVIVPTCKAVMLVS